MPKFLKSKKWWGHLMGMVVIMANEYFGIAPAASEQLMAIVMAYLAAQGVADFGKGRAEIDRGVE